MKPYFLSLCQIKWRCQADVAVSVSGGQHMVYTCLSLVLAVGFLVLPLFVWFWSAIPFEVPKVWWFDIWTEVLLGLWIVNVMVEARLAKKTTDQNIKSLMVNNQTTYLMLILLFTAIISSLLSGNFTHSLWGNYFRMDGLLTLLHLIIVAYVVGCLSQKFGSNFVTKPLVMGTSLAVWLSSGWALLEKALVLTGGRSSFFWQGFSGAGFGNPNFLAGYLVVCLPIFWLLLQSLTKKLSIKLAMMAVPILAIFTTGAWMGWLGILGWLVLEIVSVLHWPMLNHAQLRQHHHQHQQLRSPQWLISLIFLILMLIAHQFGWWLGWHSITTFQADSRSRIYPKLLLAAATKPWLGFGYANVATAFNAVQWPKNLKLNHDIYLDKAHSQLLEMLVTTGVVGLMLYLGITLTTAKKLFKQRQRTLLITFILFVLYSQTNIISIAQEVVFWTIVGLSMIE